MFPGIIVFGLALAVAYTFTKVGGKSPLSTSVNASIPPTPQVAPNTQHQGVHPDHVALFNQLNTAAPEQAHTPQLVEMTDAEFAAAQAAQKSGPTEPTSDNGSFADSVFAQAANDQKIQS